MSIREIAEQLAELSTEEQQQAVELAKEIRAAAPGIAPPEAGEEDEEMRPLQIGDPSISVTEIFGIWADRTDITDGAEWVHNLRRGPVWNRLKR